MLNQMLVSNLKEFGLSEYESRTYLVLSIYGSSIASFISQRTRIPSSKIYDVLNSLKAKGLVETCSTKPKRFRAMEPNHALNSIIERREMGIGQLRERAAEILNTLKPIEEEDKSQIWSSTGKKTFYNKTAEVLSNSEKNAIGITTNFSRNPYLDSGFLKAREKGVHIRMLGIRELTKDAEVRAKWYLKNGAEIRVFPLDTHAVFGMNDNNEVIFRINSKSSYDFIWSKNRALIDIIKLYFEHIWSKADSIQLD